MTSRRRFHAWLRCLAALPLLALGAVPAAATDFELTPRVGYRVNGDFQDKATGERMEFDDDNAFGLLFDIDLDGNSFIEILVTRQDTVLAPDDPSFSGRVVPMYVDYIQGGGAYQWDKGRFQPFVSGLLGITHMDPQDNADSEVRFSFSLGFGVKTYFNDRFGLRFDAQIMGTAFDGDDELFCDAGSCFIVKGTIMDQEEVALGMIYRFGKD